MSTEYILAALGAIGGLIGWLLAEKDAKQGKEIATLFALHKEDTEKLASLELLIARNHYEKIEVDKIIDNFRIFLEKRFDRIERLVEGTSTHKTEDRQ